jgi:hypothetical protein
MEGDLQVLVIIGADNPLVENGLSCSVCDEKFALNDEFCLVPLRLERDGPEVGQTAVHTKCVLSAFPGTKEVPSETFQ